VRNFFIENMDKKDVDHFTTDIGLKLRKKFDKLFKKLCNVFTNVNIIRINNSTNITDDEYFSTLNLEKVSLSNYNLKKKKNNIIVERYPQLNKDEPYIFVCNHTCPEDIETVLNILDRNAYLVLGSIETLKHNPEMYLTWLNGMIPFDILDKYQRKEVILKMERVLKTNSILIFPEGSHNYNPNKIINNLFDGPVNLSLKTKRKIVIVTLVRDKENNVSYIDLSNPVELDSLGVCRTICQDESEAEKKYVKELSLRIRDKMATAVYHMMVRHFDIIDRNSISNIENFFREQCIIDAFEQMKWKSDVFEAEYLVKKTEEEKKYEEVIKTLSNLKLHFETMKSTQINHKDYVLRELDLQQKDVTENMRKHLIETSLNDVQEETLKRRK